MTALTVRVAVARTGAPVDTVIQTSENASTVAQVAAALGFDTAALHVNDVCVAGTANWAAMINAGALVTPCGSAGIAGHQKNGASEPTCQPPPETGASWVLVHRAGLGAGAAQPLPPGRHHLHAHDDSTSGEASAPPTSGGEAIAPLLALDVTEEQVVVTYTHRVVPESTVVSAATSADREGPSLLIDMGLGILSLQPAASLPDIAEPVAGTGNRGGQVAVHRAPRIDGAPPVPADNQDKGANPMSGPVGDRPKMSWVMFLVPLPIGILMAVLFSPYYALFTALGPLSAAGRWLEATIRWRRATRESDAANDTQTLEQAAARQVWENEHARWLGLRFPGAAVLMRRCATRDSRLWQIRPDHPDFLTVSPGLAATGHHCGLPLGVPLVNGAVVAVIGPQPARNAVARQMLLQLATDSGPADVGFQLYPNARDGGPASKTGDWRFLSWLPHAVQVGGASPAEAVGPPVSVVLVDGAQQATTSFPGLAGALAEPPPTTAWIVLGSSTRDLPTSVTHIIQLDQDGQLTTVASGAMEVLRAEGVSVATADCWARKLAPLVDPLAASVDLDRAIESVVPLGQLLDLRAGAIGHRWSAAGRGDLRCPLGLTASGPLVVDLVADGPHGLVAGTTGSGKSELLRSLIVGLAASYRPDFLQFLLIDFKGGGAFDACTELPHVSSVLTDLDAGLAQRALTGLRAEVQRRELVLRSQDVSDIVALPTGVMLPRLVMVVDEFATLAAELPNFVDSLVDVAQRGRSLGIHLVLATQRPSGVVDHKIRANTALRVALRVQSPPDSVDVLGSPEAAEIPGSRPGRAWITGAQTPLTEFQAASVSHAPPESIGVVVRHGPTATDPQWFPAGRRGHAEEDNLGPQPDGPGQPVGAQNRPLVTVVGAVAAARDDHGFAVPGPVFLEPLPSELTPTRLSTLGDSTMGDSTFGDTGTALSIDDVVVGVVDLPAERAQRRWGWPMATGSLLGVGVRAGDTGGLIRAIAWDYCRTFASTERHLWLIDGGAVDLGLSGLAHCGAVVTGSDVDRVDRLLRLLEQPSPSDAGPRHRLLLIEQLDALQAAWLSAGRADLEERVHRLITNGTNAGVTVAVTARSERTVPLRIASHIPNRLVFQLADHQNLAMFGLRPADVPPLPAERAIDPSTGHQVQIVHVPAGPVRSPWTVPDDPTCRAAAVPDTPTEVDVHDLEPAAFSSRRLTVPLGVRRDSLEPCELELGPGEHGLLVGTSAAAIRELIALQCERGRVPVIAVSPLTDLDQLAGVTAPSVLLVATEERLTAEVQKRLGELADTPGVNIIASARVDDALQFGSWIQSLRRSRCGVLVGDDPRLGDVLRVNTVRSSSAAFTDVAEPTWLVNRGATTAVLVATASATR